MEDVEVWIDDETWSGADEARRQDWRQTIQELLDPSQRVLRDDLRRLEVVLTQQAIVLEAYGDGGTRLVSTALPHDRLADTIREYVDIVRQLGRDDAPGGLSRLEALDMAKKVTHDKAGRVLKRHFSELGMDHPTARRLFTLVVALKVDTTRLHGVYGHRRIR